MKTAMLLVIPPLIPILAGLGYFIYFSEAAASGIHASIGDAGNTVMDTR